MRPKLPGSQLLEPRPLALILFAFILLASPGAKAAAPPELFCDPDAKISFQSRWLRENSVRIVSGLSFELPWTGKEALVPGQQLKDSAPGSLAEIAEDSNFVAFRSSAEDSRQKMLFIQRELVTGTSDDGLVIAGTNDSLSLFHCRSR